MKHKLESRLPGETYNLRYADDITLVAESEEELKSLLIRVKEEDEKTGLKFNIQKLMNGKCGIWSCEFSSVQSLSRVQLFATLASCEMPGWMNHKL